MRDVQCSEGTLYQLFYIIHYETYFHQKNSIIFGVFSSLFSVESAG